MSDESAATTAATPSKGKATKRAAAVSKAKAAVKSAAAPPKGRPGSAAKPPAKSAAKRSDADLTQRAKVAAVKLKQLGDATRLTVIFLLNKSARLNVTEICEKLGQSQPAVSHHLALLRHGSIIIPTREGKNNFYALTEAGEKLAQVVDSMI